MNNYLPSFLLQGKILSQILKTQEVETTDLNNAIEDVISQLFVDTSTWGLKYWEDFLGIDIDETKSYELRRSIVKTKLRGAGVVTADSIKNIAQSFSSGSITVTENFSPYTFNVDFEGDYSYPKYIEDFISFINEIKPAHLNMSLSETHKTELSVKQRIYRHIYDYLIAGQKKCGEYHITSTLGRSNRGGLRINSSCYASENNYTLCGVVPIISNLGKILTSNTSLGKDFYVSINEYKRCSINVFSGIKDINKY